ncbi:hypothetical protein RND81_08G109300 [Saponaria officinalis]|uniref:Peptidase C45 hydrolase domain-containing protein n=1 Tax=Saponaria officinalis TaxID=3572 RepID=A0AAW1J6B8_SAPOF
MKLIGVAEGSGVPILDRMPFVPKKEGVNILEDVDTPDECSDVLVVKDAMAIAAHNEDANVALIANFEDGLSYTAYTYAGELPTCAFGFNTYEVAFTLNSVAPLEEEIVAGAIGRNFVSRDLLEATSISDAIENHLNQKTKLMIRPVNASYFGHPSNHVQIGGSQDSNLGSHGDRVTEGSDIIESSHQLYLLVITTISNLIDIPSRKIINVEAASKNRISVYEIGSTPFFHANMYLHLQVPQVITVKGIDIQKRSSFSQKTVKAASLPKETKDDFLSVLGNTDDDKYPLYTTGPKLYTLCTAVFDLGTPSLSIIEGNPKEGRTAHVFHMTRNGS